MQTIIEQAQPYITTIVTTIIGAFVAVLLAAVGVVKAKAVTHLDSKLDAAQRELLHKVASEAFAYAQTVYSELEAEGKLQQALNYATEQLTHKGIKITPVEIRAAIEVAYLKYKAKALTK